MQVFKKTVACFFVSFFSLSLVGCSGNLFQAGSGPSAKKTKSPSQRDQESEVIILDDDTPVFDVFEGLKNASVGNEVFEAEGYTFANLQLIATDIMDYPGFLESAEDMTVKDFKEELGEIEREDLLAAFSDFSMDYRGLTADSSSDNQGTDEDLGKDGGAQAGFALSAPAGTANNNKVGSAADKSAIPDRRYFPEFGNVRGLGLPGVRQTAAGVVGGVTAMDREAAGMWGFAIPARPAAE